MSDNNLPSIFDQDTVLSAAFDSTLFGILLLGIYTTVYFSTMYMSLANRSSRSLLVLSAITVLYLVYVAQTGIQWFLIKSVLGMIGQPKIAAFIFVASGPGWFVLVSDICTFLLATIADGLLIWRCYNIWDRSLRVILPALLILLAEIGLDLSIVIITCIQNLQPSPTAAVLLNHLLSASLFVTLAATLLTTLLIAYRIHSVSRNDLLKRTKQSFKNILELLIESAAIYSIGSLFFAIEGVVPPDASNRAILFALGNYANIIFSFTAGMAPTVMVARITLTASREVNRQSTARISGVMFQGQNTSVDTSEGVAPSTPALEQEPKEP